MSKSPILKADQERLWRSFREGEAVQAIRLSTLSFLFERCEREGVPYHLSARPGFRYAVQLLKD